MDKSPGVIVNELIDILRIEEVNKIPEILEVYGLLGYMLGLSIEGFDPEEEIPLETLKQLYLRDNSVGAALMLQSNLIRTWSEAWMIQQRNVKERMEKDATK